MNPEYPKFRLNALILTESFLLPELASRLGPAVWFELIYTPSYLRTIVVPFRVKAWKPGRPSTLSHFNLYGPPMRRVQLHFWVRRHFVAAAREAPAETSERNAYSYLTIGAPAMTQFSRRAAHVGDSSRERSFHSAGSLF
jgi:hypothetical protein